MNQKELVTLREGTYQVTECLIREWRSGLSATTPYRLLTGGRRATRGWAVAARGRDPKALIAINNTPPTRYRARLLNNRSVLGSSARPFPAPYPPPPPGPVYAPELAHELELAPSALYDLSYYTNTDITDPTATAERLFPSAERF